MQAPPTAKKPRGPLFWVLLIGGLVLVIPGCCGVMAAIAIPSFTSYLQRAKTSEAEANLRNLYTLAAGYHAQEFVGPDGVAVTGCAVPSAATPNVPGPGKTLLDQLPASFGDLGASFPDPIYYQYEIVSPGGCGHPPGTELYTFRARGDLDGDGVQSSFEITARTSPTGELERSPDIARVDETE